MVYFFKRYYKYFLILFCAIVIFVSVYVYNRSSTVTTSSDEKLTVTEEKEDVNNESDDSTSTVFVDIKGAIASPGVYELETGKRIIDVINLAGGLTEDANTVNINLSRKLEDEMFIIIYTKEEIENYMKKQDVSEITCASYECVCPDSNNDGCYVTDSTSSNDTTSTDVTVSGKVSINTATKEELMTLSGIGEAKAQAIIEYRNSNGLFTSIEDIKNVSGIGDAIFEKIKDDITI